LHHLASYTIPVDCLTDFEMCEVAPSEKPFWRSPSLRVAKREDEETLADFGQNEYISLLVRSFSLERPKQNKLVPQWNLGLVIAALNSPPFEPAEEVDLRFRPLHQSQKIAHLASYTIPVDCLTDFEICEVAPSEKPFWRSPSLRVAKRATFLHSAFFFNCFSRSNNQIARSYLLHQPGQNKHGFQNFCFCLVPGL
jgi:hypothetical protein